LNAFPSFNKLAYETVPVLAIFVVEVVFYVAGDPAFTGFVVLDRVLRLHLSVHENV